MGMSIVSFRPEHSGGKEPLDWFSSKGKKSKKPLGPLGKRDIDATIK